MSDDLSEYERLRLANMARNRRILGDLGLGDDVVSPLRLGRRSAASGNPKAGRGSKRSVAESALPAEPPRRSARAASLPQPDYKEAWPDVREPGCGGVLQRQQPRGQRGDGDYQRGDDDEEEGGGGGGGARWNPSAVKAEASVGHALSWFRKVQSAPPPPPDADSSRAMACDVGRVLRNHLGLAMPQGHTKVSGVGRVMLMVWCSGGNGCGARGRGGWGGSRRNDRGGVMVSEGAREQVTGAA